MKCSLSAKHAVYLGKKKYLTDFLPGLMNWNAFKLIFTAGYICEYPRCAGGYQCRRSFLCVCPASHTKGKRKHLTSCKNITFFFFWLCTQHCHHLCTLGTISQKLLIITLFLQLVMETNSHCSLTLPFSFTFLFSPLFYSRYKVVASDWLPGLLVIV